MVYLYLDRLFNVHIDIYVSVIDDDHVIASAFREESPREPGEPGLVPV